jgi:tetratricopeptide (TPR) repeat protein
MEFDGPDKSNEQAADRHAAAAGAGQPGMPASQQVNIHIRGGVYAPRSVFGIANGVPGDGLEPVEVDPPKTREEAAQLLFPQFRASSEAARRLPSAWLDPAAGVLPLRARPEVADLLGWCLDELAPVLRLVCGPAGQGKTQLAAQLCAALRAPERDWLAGFVRLPPPNWRACDDADVEAGQRPAWREHWARVVATLRALPCLAVPGVLLVVDYAEGYPDFLGSLLREAASAGAPRVRILLLARDAGDWWRELADCAPAGWVEPLALELTSLPESLARQGRASLAGTTRQLWADAVGVFAAKAVAAGLLAEPAAADALAAKPPERFATTLDLYADALLRVLDRASGPSGVNGDLSGDEGEWPRYGGDAADPIAGVLRHEQRLVAHSLAATGLAGGRQRDLAVTVAFLRPASGLAAAGRALAAAPELSRLGGGQLEQVADALAAIYPASGARKLGGRIWQAPVPDRLPDTHLLLTAERCRSDAEWSQHVRQVCSAADPIVPGHAAQVLVRALSTPGADGFHPVGLRRVEQSVAGLLRAYPAAYAPLLVKLDPARFSDAIVAAVGANPAGGEAALPTASVAEIDKDLRAKGFATTRMAIATAVSRRLAADTRPAVQADEADADPAAMARHAEHLVLLSRRLAEAGSAGEALPPAREAVAWFRRLWEADPGAHRAGLASALTNLGNRLAEHGERAEALAVTGEAVALRRELAASGGGREQADYAAGLHNLAGRLLDSDQPDQAAAPAREAVAVFGRLVGEHGDDLAYRALLAVALTNLAQVLAVSARPGEAVAPATEAVEILRGLAAAKAESYLPALAAALIGLSQHLAPLAGRGRRTRSTRRAVHLAAEAVGIYQQLTGSSPAAYQPDLAAALTNLGLRHAAAGEAGQAVAATEQAVAIRRRLAQAEPARHHRELAAALTNLGLQLAAARRRAAALAAAQEAVTLYRTDPTANADARPRADLAAALGNLGYRLATARRFAEAIAATSEAVDIYRRLLAGDRQRGHLVGLADALHDLGRHHAQTGQREQAADALGEAAELYEQLAQPYPETVRERYRAALAVLATVLAELAATEAGSPAPVDGAASRRAPAWEIAQRYCRRWREETVRMPLPGVVILVAWRTDLAPRTRRQGTVREDITALFDRNRRGAQASASGQTAQPTASLPVGSVAATAAVESTAAVELTALDPAAAQQPTAATELAEPPQATPVEPPRPKGPAGLAARVVGRGQDALASAGARAARLPGVDLLVQQAQGNPAIARIIGGIAALVIAVLTGAALLGPADQPHADEPRPPYAIPLPTGSTSPATPPPPGPTPSLTTPAIESTPTPIPSPSDSGMPEGSGGGSGGGGGSSTGEGSNASQAEERNDPGGEATEPSPTPTVTTSSTPTQTSTSPPPPPPPPPPCASGCAIAFDATELSYSSFKIPGVTDDWVDTGGVQTLRLTPGLYHFQTPDGTSDVTFEVTEDGKVGYDASFAGFLSGAGGSTLQLRGYAIGVDATTLSYQKLALKVAGVERGFDSNASQSLRLLPGRHRVEVPEKSFDVGFDVGFDVTVDGKVDYDPGLNGLLSGSGTRGLVVRGYEVGLDATQLSYEKLVLQIVGLDAELDAATPRTLRLLPGAHRVEAPAMSFGVEFDVTAAGKVEYDRGLAYLSGWGKPTLTLQGLPVKVDATGVSAETWGFHGVLWRNASQPVVVRLLPGQYMLSTGGDTAHGTVTVTSDGVFEYDRGLAYLSGWGKPTLTLLGLPVKVDATGVSAETWGFHGVLWRNASQPVVVRLLPGQYRFQAPDAGLDFVFTVTAAGTVDYDPSLTYLSGQGTSTLIVGQSGSAAFSGQSDGRNRQLFNLIILVLLTVVVLAVWRARSAQQFGDRQNDVLRSRWRPCPCLQDSRFGRSPGHGTGRRSVRRVRWRGLRSPLA